MNENAPNDIPVDLDRLQALTHDYFAKYCDPDKPSGFLDFEGRKQKLRPLRDLAIKIHDRLCPIIGSPSAREFHTACIQGIQSITNIADIESQTDPNCSASHKSMRIAAMRKRIETSDLDLLFSDMQSTVAQRLTSKDAPPHDTPDDPIPIPWLRTVVPRKKVGGDASKLAAWLKRRDVRVSLIARRNHAERKELLRVFKAGTNTHKLIAAYTGDSK